MKNTTPVVVKATVLPSQVGVGSMDMGLLSLGKLGTARRQTSQPHMIEWDKVSYIVGDAVDDFARPIQRMDFLRLADGPEARAMTYTSLGLTLGVGGRHTVAIMVGLPVEVMLNTPVAKETLRGLKSWLVGEHVFCLDGQETVVTVAGVKIMAQPAGSLFAWGMNDEGTWIRDLADLENALLVCDIGFNTLDLFAIQAHRITRQFTGGDTAGIRRAAEMLMQTVRARYDVAITRLQADAFLRSPKPIFSYAGGDEDLQPFVQQALGSAAAQIGDFVETKVGNGRQFRRILFSGGGSELLRADLTRRYPHGEFIPNPVTANALGLARIARREPDWADEPVIVGLDPGFGGFKLVALVRENEPVMA